MATAGDLTLFRPRPALATQLAYAAAEEAKRRPVENAAEVVKPPVQPAPQQEIAAVPPPPVPLEFMKLAQLIETPIPEQPAAKALERAFRIAGVVGDPSFWPRSLAARSAALVRAEINSRSFSASARKR